MKKILFVLVASLAISASCTAQTEKGKMLLGGAIWFRSAKSSYSQKKSTFINVMPNVGYFIADNLAIGGGIGYLHHNDPAKLYPGYPTWTPAIKSNNFSISTFGRYYIGLTPEIKFFSQLSGSIDMQQSKYTDESGNPITDRLKNRVYDVSLSPGFAIFPSRKIGIELSFTGFQYRKGNGKYPPDPNKNEVSEVHFRSFDLGANFFTPHLGVQFYF
ncbi:outer membrane beta-barrel protein [Pedobacter cryoconitis]|uniref:Outer membrane protein n=1 Tax=Pedobacter cryoconitis TaxID=188932 RepID=A0A7X0J565_9SPHI|nr:outer membrane beta-barrel protein [Pedobacter cryoconitis]MBB6500022.1 outer membrane protein [Pedobacter cryoconitis]